MANKRQKKKRLKRAFTTVSKFVNDVNEFQNKMDAEIKKDPWKVREKLLGMDELNHWTFYFIAKCNVEIRKRI